MLKKILVIITLILTIGMTSTYSVASYFPEKVPHSIALTAAAIDFARLPGTIRQINEDAALVHIIEALDSQLYSRQVGHLVKFPSGLDWSFVSITGEKAIYLLHKWNAYAVTIPMLKLVVFLDIEGANRWLVMAHEFTHVLQTEDGTISTRDRIYVEYQAEVNSRSVIGALEENFVLPKKLMTKPLSTVETLAAIRLLIALTN